MQRRRGRSGPEESLGQGAVWARELGPVHRDQGPDYKTKQLKRAFAMSYHARSLRDLDWLAPSYPPSLSPFDGWMDGCIRKLND